MKIYILGLGAGSLDLISKKAYELLKNDNIKKIFRTEKHEIVDELKKENILFDSADHIYEHESNFESVYEKISDLVIEYAKSYQEVIYGVPGSPFITEDTTHKIIRKAEKENIQIEIVPSVSFIDASMCTLRKDPTKELYITDVFSIEKNKIDPSNNILISQVYDRYKATDIKLMLLDIYDDEQSVYLLTACGGKNEKIEKMKLYKMDYEKYEYNHLTSIFIEKVQEKKYNDIGDLRNEVEKLYEGTTNFEEIQSKLLKNMEKLIEKIKNNYEYIEDVIPSLLADVFSLSNIVVANNWSSYHEIINAAVNSIK